MPFCSQCGTKNVDEALFCSHCGAEIAMPAYITPVPCNQAGLSFPMPFTVTRENQFISCAMTYKVIINGKDFGNIGIGKSLTTTISSEDVSVIIQCTTPMSAKIRASFKLKINHQNPSVTFKLRFGGSIDATVHGAKTIGFNGVTDQRLL